MTIHELGKTGGSQLISDLNDLKLAHNKEEISLQANTDSNFDKIFKSNSFRKLLSAIKDAEKAGKTCVSLNFNFTSKLDLDFAIDKMAVSRSGKSVLILPPSHEDHSRRHRKIDISLPDLIDCDLSTPFNPKLLVDLLKNRVTRALEKKISGAEVKCNVYYDSYSYTGLEASFGLSATFQKECYEYKAKSYRDLSKDDFAIRSGIVEICVDWTRISGENAWNKYITWFAEKIPGKKVSTALILQFLDEFYALTKEDFLERNYNSDGLFKPSDNLYEASGRDEYSCQELLCTLVAGKLKAEHCEFDLLSCTIGEFLAKIHEWNER